MIGACGPAEPVSNNAGTVSTPPPRETKTSTSKTFVEEEDVQDKWIYDATNKHDPFILPEPLDAGSIENVFDVDQMVLYGVFRGSNKDRAFIKLPNGDDLIVKLDDKLGKHGGVVSEIGPDYITVKEQFIDPYHPDKIFIIEKQLPLVLIKKK